MSIASPHWIFDFNLNARSLKWTNTAALCLTRAFRFQFKISQDTESAFGIWFFFSRSSLNVRSFNRELFHCIVFISADSVGDILWLVQMKMIFKNKQLFCVKLFIWVLVPCSCVYSILSTPAEPTMTAQKLKAWSQRSYKVSGTVGPAHAENHPGHLDNSKDRQVTGVLRLQPILPHLWDVQGIRNW